MRLQSISSVLRKSNAFLPQLYRWHGCWRTVRIGYTYLNYEDRDYYETPLIHSVTTTRPDGSETLYYTYDERGNITSIRRGVNDIVCRYTYDDLGQLIREDNKAHGATYTWTYDNAGNILSSKTYAYTTGSLGSAQRTVSYDYSSGSWGDLLTSNNGRSVTYDNIGNPLRWNDYGELTWQGRRLMRYYESEMECESLYTYNADGIRTSKTVNGVKHTYHLSGTQILSEEWTDRWNRHVMVYIYDAAGQPIGMTHFQDGTLVDTYLYEKNIQGDVVAVYDYAGDLVVRYAYNAWGAVSETEYGSEYCEESFEVLCNPFRYRGYYYDTETDFYYLNSRYYDPGVGRFINADGQLNESALGYNLFAYCENNPVMRYDPLGDFGWDNLFEGALLMAIGVMTVAAVALTGGSCIPLVALAYAAVATSGTLLVGLGATEVIEGFTGVNPVRDEMGEETYETVKALALGVASMAPAVISVGSEISTCFVAGTQISTEEGVIAIDDICVGMKVYAHDPETGETALKEVVNTFVRESGELVHITVNGEEITTTPTHPFYVPQKGWTDAIRLRAGDRLQLLNGEYVVVEQVQHEILEAPVTVYNFEVEEFHTYYVTGSAILVHNANCGGETPAAKRGRKIHKEWNYGEGVKKERKIGPGARVDGIDYDRKIIYELKPNNTRAIRRGIKQLERYIRIKGDGWRGELITYD